MVDWNEQKQSCNVKLVFYGPALSGKTTNLISLHNLLQPELKGDMQILETQNDRTLFFDLLPLGIKTDSGMLIKLKIYTVPGQVIHDSTRKALLSRADGVIFVADSQVSQSQNNAESFQNLMANIHQVGLDLSALPLVVQFNKRDLDAIVSEQELQERWQATPWKLFYASALNHQGVIETFEQLLHQVYLILDKEFNLHQQHQLPLDSFVQRLLGKTNQSE